ncbi:MAG: 16S rRNA processing protein RimM [Deltaproteobacteria bacterium]|nr:MAG: 16S rRNA processing protein RimM [Deltaproteobacteria bacterium]PIE73453.1 MAG: 16S rRNA processing protein RimM [Deltaproteobacteria bacterium]
MAEPLPSVAEYLHIGKVTRPHGLRGELKIFCFSGQPENLKDYSRLTFYCPAEKTRFCLEITAVRLQAKVAIVRFSGLLDRDRAEGFSGCDVYLLRKDLPTPADGGYYWSQLIGKRVFTVDGACVGGVTKVFHSGAQDVLVVGAGPQEILIPLVDELIVREEEEALVVDLPPGLLEINLATPES